MKRHSAVCVAVIACGWLYNLRASYAQPAAPGAIQRFSCEDGLEGEPELIWNDDGAFAVAKGMNVTCLIDLQSGELFRHERENFIAWQPGTRHFLAVRGWLSRRGKPTLVMVDAQTRRTLAKRVLGTRAEIDLHFSSDGKYLSHGSPESDLDVWDAETLRSVDGAQVAHGPGCSSVAATWRPGTHQIAVANFCKNARKRSYRRLTMLDVDAGLVFYSEKFLQPEAPTESLLDWPEWSPDGSSFAWSATDGNVMVMSADGDVLLDVAYGTRARPYWNTGSDLLALLKTDGTIIVDVSSGAVLRSAGPELATALDFQWLDADTALAEPDAEGHVWALNVRSGVRKLLWTTQAREFNRLYLSPDKRHVAVSNWLEMGVQVLRMSDGIEVMRDAEGSGDVNWSPDSRSISYAASYESMVASLPKQ